MKILIGCEYSDEEGAAFRALGHDVTTCDLLPTESTDPASKHYQGDVRDILNDGFDLAVFHPTCTFLCNSGVRWLHTDHERWKHMVWGAVFFRELLNAPIPMVAVENPIMHRYAASIIGRRQDQVIQPWMFGHPETKGTGLWLRGLPPLTPTNNVREHMLTLPKAEQSRIHYMSPGADRWKERSRTFTGIAEAMAAQWGQLDKENEAA